MSLSYHKQYLSSSSQKLVQEIESTFSEKKRTAAISKLIEKAKRDECRSLIALFYYVTNQQTKILLLQGICKSQIERGFYFVISYIEKSSNKILAQEAVRSLKYSKFQGTVDYLYSLLKKKKYEYFESVLWVLNFFPPPIDTKTLTYILKDPFITPKSSLYISLLLSRVHDISVKTGNFQMLDLLSMNPRVTTSEKTPSISKKEIADTYELFNHYWDERGYQRDLLISQLKIEDIIVLQDHGRSKKEQDLSIDIILKGDRKKLWEEFALFQEEVSATQRCLWRTLLYDPKRWEEDLQFIKDHHSSVDISVLSLLVQKISTTKMKNLNDKLLETIPNETYILLSKRVYWQEAAGSLLTIVEQKIYPKSNVMETLRALFFQLLCSDSQKVWDQSVKRLIEILKKEEEDKSAKGAVIRCLGELQVDREEFYKYLESYGLKDIVLRPSCIYALENLPTPRSCQILIKSIQDFQNTKLGLSTLYRALARASSGQSLSLESLPIKRDSNQVPSEIILLLTQNQITDCDSLIYSYLKHDEYQKVLWALDAFHINPFLKGWPIIINLLENKNPQIVQKAIEILCKLGSKEHHRKVINLVSSVKKYSQHSYQVFRFLAPQEKSDYRSSIRLIESFLEKERLEKSIIKLAHKTIERLQASTEDYLLESDSLTKKQGPLSSYEVVLQKKIFKYQELPIAVKGVLLDCLTAKDRGLFDQTVLLTQWSKALDVLFYTLIGKNLLSKDSSLLLSKLQSRLLDYKLFRGKFEEEDFLKEFSCSEFFKTHEFPFSKLYDLSDSLLSDRVFKDQLRFLDGPRAWALILLLFGRSFLFQGQKYEPLIFSSSMSSKEIVKISYQLCRIQEARNKGAHRALYFSDHLWQVIENDTYHIVDFFMKNRRDS